MVQDARFAREDPNPIPLDALKHPDFDVREFRADDDIMHIAQSLEREGQYMPIYVGQKEGDQYPILDGNHRYLAAKRLGWSNLDAIRLGVNRDADMAQVITNLTRLELSAGDRLFTFDYMLNSLEMDQGEAAEKVGISRTQANKYARVLSGFGEVRQFYLEEELGLDACWELNKLDDRDRAVDIAETAVREGYVDRDVTEQARNARGEEAAQDVMRGAGGQQNMQNRMQVQKNAEAMQDLDPIDDAGIQQARSPPDQEQPEQPTGEPEGDREEYDGPVCHACMNPRQEESTFRYEPPGGMLEGQEFDAFKLCGECGAGLLKMIQERQQTA